MPTVTPQLNHQLNHQLKRAEGNQGLDGVMWSVWSWGTFTLFPRMATTKHREVSYSSYTTLISPQPFPMAHTMRHHDNPFYPFIVTCNICKNVLLNLLGHQKKKKKCGLLQRNRKLQRFTSAFHSALTLETPFRNVEPILKQRSPTLFLETRLSEEFDLPVVALRRSTRRGR